MNETVLVATNRTENAKKTRDAGFTPAVLNQNGATSTSVQFDTLAINKIIATHGTNAKLFVTIGNDKKFGYIKEVQRKPVDRSVVHVAVQLVDVNLEMKMNLPIHFHGVESLENRQLMLLTIKSEVEVFGKAGILPDSAIADVSEMVLGDTVTAKFFNFPDNISVIDAEDEHYAVVKAVKEVAADAVDEDTEASEAVEEVAAE